MLSFVSRGVDIDASGPAVRSPAAGRTGIMFHVHALASGGAEKQLCYLVRGLAERNWDVHVATFSSDGPLWREMEEWGGCTLVNLRRRSRADFGVIRRLARYIREHDIQIVQGWMPPSNSFAVLAGLMTGKPALMGYRNANLGGDNMGMGVAVYTTIDIVLSRFARSVICNSSETVAVLRKAGYPAARLTMIPNGVVPPDSPQFCVPDLGRDHINLGVLARLAPNKDHETLFRAMRHLKAELAKQSRTVHLHVFGDGKPEYREKLQALAGELSIDRDLTWHGHVRNVWQSLQLIDILVSSSRVEGMSNSVMEAMLAKRVVVATDVGDTGFLLRGEGGRACGYLVPPGQPGALANAVMEAIGNPAASAASAEAARLRMLQEFSTDAMICGYQKIYERYVEAAA